MTKFSRGLAAALAAAALAACTPSQSRPTHSAAAPGKPPPARPTQARPPAPNPVTQGLNLGGQTTLVTMPDRQHPQWPLCKLLMNTFVSTYSNNSVQGHGVTAFLFDKGQRRGVMTAPDATGNIVTEMVFATGGVHLVSVAPAGRFLDADSVIWNAKTQLGKAYGHVHYRDAKSGMTLVPPVLYFNSGLKQLSSSPLPGGS